MLPSGIAAIVLFFIVFGVTNILAFHAGATVNSAPRRCRVASRNRRPGPHGR